MYSLDGAVEGGVAERRLVVVNVVHIELEAEVAGIEALVGLEAVDEGGVLERLDLLVDGVVGELSVLGALSGIWGKETSTNVLDEEVVVLEMAERALN